MKCTFAFSPCPNDTFMFEAIVNKRIDLHGIDFEFVLEDVAQLNQDASHCKYDITKLSYNAFTTVTSDYQLMTSGSALGNNCGPILISKNEIDKNNLGQYSVAIPGINTTANLLLTIAYPEITNKSPTIFSEVENMVSSGITELGLIIHENRFTYQKRGLLKVQDLGEYWESNTGCPIPLGGIAVRRSMDDKMKIVLNKILANSIKFAFKNPETVQDYVSAHAQEMDINVMKSHINLYVNENSISISEKAIAGINRLFDEIRSIYPDRDMVTPIFIGK